MWWFIFFVALIIVSVILGLRWDEKQKKKRTEAVNQKLFEIENFTVSIKVDGFGGFYIFAIDEINEKVALITELFKRVVSFSDIIGVELIEDGNTVLKKSATRTIGGAIVGGALAGGAGTIVGGLSGNSKQKNKVSSVSVKILLRNLENPTLTIDCFNARTMTAEGKSIETEGKSESHIYKTCKRDAERIRDLVSVIIDRVDNNAKTEIVANENIENKSNSVADELIKLNELKEKGILTEEEFILQKNRILN